MGKKQRGRTSKPTSTGGKAGADVARPAERLERAFGVTLPDRLKSFFAGEHTQYEGARIVDLPGYSPDTALGVRFATRDLPRLHETGVARGGKLETHFPIAKVGSDEPRLVAVNLTQPELPVLYLDYEGGYSLHDDTFDEFLGGLVKPGDATPYEQIERTHRKARKLVSKRKFAAAKKIIAKVLDPSFARGRPWRDLDAQELVAKLWHLLGQCEQGSKDPASARQAFERAFDLGCRAAGVDLAEDLLSRADDHEAALDVAEEVRRGFYPFLDLPAWFRLNLLLGRLYLRAGREREAALAYEAVVDRASDDELDTIAAELSAVAVQHPERSEAAERIRDWIMVPEQQPALTPERVARLRSWWQGVAPEVRLLLSEAAYITAETLSDQDLDTIARLERLEIKHEQLPDLEWIRGMPWLEDLTLVDCHIDDLAPLASLRFLRSLCLDETEVQSLAPLADLRRLERVDAKECGLTSLSGLENKPDLETVKLSDNQIESLAPLSDAPSLHTVEIDENPVRDISVLATCPQLRRLGCRYNRRHTGLETLAPNLWLEAITNFGAFSDREFEAFAAARRAAKQRLIHRWVVDEVPADEAARLEAWYTECLGVSKQLTKRLDEKVEHAAWHVAMKDGEGGFEEKKSRGRPPPRVLAYVCTDDSISFDACDLRTLELLTVFARATFCNISDNPRIEDLGPLAKLRWLRKVVARGLPRVTTLAPLEPLEHLTHLCISGSGIASLAGAERWRGLRRLEANGTRLADLDAVSGMKELRELSLCGAEVADLQPLASLGQLRELDVSLTLARDVTPVATCPNLTELRCFGNPGLTGLLALRDLPYLRRVSTRRSASPDDLAALAAARPDIEID